MSLSFLPFPYWIYTNVQVKSREAFIKGWQQELPFLIEMY